MVLMRNVNYWGTYARLQYNLRSPIVALDWDLIPRHVIDLYFVLKNGR